MKLIYILSIVILIIISSTFVTINIINQPEQIEKTLSDYLINDTITPFVEKDSTIKEKIYKGQKYITLNVISIRVNPHNPELLILVYEEWNEYTGCLMETTKLIHSEDHKEKLLSIKLPVTIEFKYVTINGIDHILSATFK